MKVNLPLIGDINAVIARNGLPFEVNLTQKVNLLGKRMAVAWSGDKQQAERAVRALSAISHRDNLKAQDICAELDAIDPEAIKNLQLLGFLVRDVKGKVVEGSVFSLGVDGCDIPQFGTVHVAGSGRNTFLRLLRTVDWLQAGPNEHQIATALLAGLINEEYANDTTIRERWGGGFEAVFFQRKQAHLKRSGRCFTRSGGYLT